MPATSISDSETKSLSSQPMNKSTEKWDAPLFEGMPDGGYLTASHLEDLQKQAYDEAYSEGYAAGLEAGEADLKQRTERLDQLLASLARPYELLDESVEKSLVDLAITIAKQLFRRELRVDPTHIIGVVREAIQLLPGSSRDVRIKLHPEDMALVAELLAKPEGERAWSMEEDPLIDRGGCRVVTENSQIDAQVDKRFEAVVTSIVGDER
jgi:flagellar assembly protein FliH